VAGAVRAGRQADVDHVAGLRVLAVSVRPRAEQVAAEVVVVHLDSAQLHGSETLWGEFAGRGDEADELLYQRALRFDLDIEQHQLGVPVILEKSDGVAPSFVVTLDLDECPAVDPDRQVESVHYLFVGVSVTFEAHADSLATGCNGVSEDWSPMADIEGAKTFGVSGATYDLFMGRYSRALAEPFADAAGVRAGQTVVDVGCGPGALTGVLVDRLGAEAVVACDPSPKFVAECSTRHPGVRVEVAPAESIPFDTGCFHHAMAQLVLHFVSEPERAASEMMRVVRPGGRVSACVWDFDDGMEMLRGFWDAALELAPEAPDEARTMRFGRPGEIAELFASAGLSDVATQPSTSSGKASSEASAQPARTACRWPTTSGTVCTERCSVGSARPPGRSH
jgi:SAM-dependent methyltransferase